MDDNPENVAEMPFVPWLDVKSTNPVETAGIILFFLIIGFGIYYLFKKKREEHIVPHIEIEQTVPSQDYSYFDDKDFDITELHSTLNLPKGIRVTLQRMGDDKQYEATIINITEDNFIVFINNDPDHKYNPVNGEKTQFFAELNDMRWSFATEFFEVYDDGVRGYIFYHTYDIFITRKRKEARVHQELPALFAVIPRSVVLGPIPIEDLLGKIQGEVPATIHDISSSGCALHTRSPIEFREGDLTILNFVLPSSSEEQSIFASINRKEKKKQKDGGGSILNMEFIKTSNLTDNIIKNLVSSHIEDEIIV